LSAPARNTSASAQLSAGEATPPQLSTPNSDDSPPP
jgi:hypothetical protein